MWWEERLLGMGGLALWDLSTSGEGMRSRNIPNQLCNLHHVITTLIREGKMRENGKAN